MNENKPQIDKFRETARQLEADESEANFDRALKQVIKGGSDKPVKQKGG